MNRPKVQNDAQTMFLEGVPSVPSCASGSLVEKNSSWRTLTPVIDRQKCKACMLCYLLCPEGVIYKSNGKVAIDFDFCKGCGICAHECKFDAIKMEKEQS